MCGISAIVSPDPQVREHLTAMLGTQWHRGPDHVARWERAHVALGHNRLSLVDLGPTGDQPMEGERYAITYNGEVYNHLELRRLVKDYPWKGTSDTETILALIERFGMRATLQMLNGMFAMAVWDKDLRVLMMATDRFGVKPLYVYSPTTGGVPEGRGGTFACASSSAALLHLQPTWQLDRVGIAEFFHLGGSARGVWKGIERIGGGQMLLYSAASGTLSQERWYTPTFNPNAAEELPGLITDAIRISAQADVPVGLFYSGGIDTSVVASVLATSHEPRATSPAGAARGSQLEARSAFHLDSPEIAYAQKGANHFGLNLHIVPADPRAVKLAHTDIATKTGEPTMAGHIPWIVSRAASQFVKAAISGNGADELFFGYDRTPRNMDTAELEAQAQHLFRRGTFARSMPHWHIPDLHGPWPWDAHPRWVELQTYVQHDLNPTLDAASMCHHLELRVPFLDHRVVEAALSLPSGWHGTKRVLKNMLHATGLGADFIDRPKLGFSMATTTTAGSIDGNNAWAWACQLMGWDANAKLGPRDNNYVRLCAIGLRAWYDVHQHRIAA